jgi:hypothetical protein
MEDRYYLNIHNTHMTKKVSKNLEQLAPVSPTSFRKYFPLLDYNYYS